MEVRLVASLSAGDIRTATGSNIFGIRREFKVDNKPLLDMRGEILEARLEVQGQDRWRLLCLNKYLRSRCNLQANLQDTTEIDLLIESMYSS